VTGRQISQKLRISAGENVFDDIYGMGSGSFWSWIDV